MILNIIILGLVFASTGCTAINHFSRRSDITFKIAAESPVDKPKRLIEGELELHGSNRDVLQAYKAALEFTLQEFGLKK